MPCTPVPRPLWPVVVTLVLVTLTWPAAPGSSQSNDSDVVVVGKQVSGDYVNVTLTTYTKPGLIRAAGLLVNGSLVSNEVGGISLTYGSNRVLPFEMQGGHFSRVDLRVLYETQSGGTTNTKTHTIRMDLLDAVDLRPVDATIGDGGNVTVTLQNFGNGTARGFIASLRDADGDMAGVPYYRDVPPVPAGGSLSVSFTLVQAADRPTLFLESGGSPQKHTLYLRTLDGATTGAGSGVTLTADLPSLSGTPGNTVTFALKLRNSGPERTVELSTEGLPEAYNPTFTVQGSRVQSVRLAAGTTRDVTLTVTVPSATNETQTPVGFQALATGTTSTARLASLALEVTPSGTARLELSGRNWFASVEPGGARSLSLTIKNPGSAAAHNVRPTATAPTGWQVRFEPSVIERIAPGEEADVRVTIDTPGSTADGRYVVDIGAESGATVARERSLAVEVTDPPAPRWPWLFAVAAVGAVAVYLIIRIRRR